MVLWIGLTAATVAHFGRRQLEVTPSTGQLHACGAIDVQARHAVDAGLGDAVAAHLVVAVFLYSKIQDGSPFFGVSS